MDVRGAAATMAKASGSVHATLLPLEKMLGTLVSKTSQANSQIHRRFIIRRTAVTATACSSGNKFGPGGPSRVDREMIVLRKRMQELRMKETKYVPPQHWMQWEKEWSITYASDICQFLGWLQNILINTRPGLTIAALALISFSVPAFVFFLLFQVFQVSAPHSDLAVKFLTKLLDVSG